MNVLFSVGCDRYDLLTPLSGAEQDANAVFNTLVANGYYSEDRSALMLSPSTIEMTEALSRILRQQRIEVFTFFFAGHAGGKNGSFFLALRDSDQDALSTTSFPLVRLFEMINEFQPRQVNVIIDGCEAGASLASAHTLLRPEALGTFHASGVSFLGACAADQYAEESDQGGLLTTHLLRALRGECDLVIRKPIIELLEIAAHISDKVHGDAPAQNPTWWGLNLFGRGGLAHNPTFHIDSDLPSLSLTTIDPASAMGKRLLEFSSELWELYRLASKGFDPSKLSNLLRRLLAPIDLEVGERVAAISGLMGSFASIAKSDGELLSRHFCVATCLTALLQWTDDEATKAFVRQQLQSDVDNTNTLLAELMGEIQANEDRLLTHNGVLSDIYYLPIRVTRMLGLIGMLALVERLLDLKCGKTMVHHQEIARTLITVYSKSLVALDDEQAAPLYIFLKAAHYFGWNEEGNGVVQTLYSDAALRAGVFNRLDSDGEGALEHILSISGSKLVGRPRYPANPSSLLPVLLLGGIWFDCAKDWDLRVFDRRNIGLFFPADYRTFNQDVITNGHTHTWQIGFGIWHIEEFEAEFRRILSSRASDVSLSPEAHVLCMLAAMLFPNRIPLNLEAL